MRGILKPGGDCIEFIGDSLRGSPAQFPIAEQECERMHSVVALPWWIFIGGAAESKKVIATVVARIVADTV